MERCARPSAVIWGGAASPEAWFPPCALRLNPATCSFRPKCACLALPDKTGGKKFSKEFEEASAKLEEFVNSLDRQVKDGPSLTEVLENAGIFYEAQYKEVKVVANVSLQEHTNTPHTHTPRLAQPLGQGERGLSGFLLFRQASNKSGPEQLGCAAGVGVVVVPALGPLPPGLPVQVAPFPA